MARQDKLDAAVRFGFELDIARQAAREPRGDPEDGALQIWWIRNVPNEATHYGVADLVEALHLYGRLAWHDLQDENGVDSNVGGLRVFLDGEWEDWTDDPMGLSDFTVAALGGRWIDGFGDLYDAFLDALRGPEEEVQ